MQFFTWGFLRVPGPIHSEEYKKSILVLKEVRKAQGMTQKFVADRLGKPQSYIAKIEGGERRMDVVEFIAFAKAIDYDACELMKKLDQ